MYDGKLKEREMPDQEQSEEMFLLKQASLEIKTLRTQNERMGLRLRMFDEVMSLVNVYPSGRDGMSMMAKGTDIAWSIDRFLDRPKTQSPPPSQSTENSPFPLDKGANDVKNTSHPIGSDKTSLQE